MTLLPPLSTLFPYTTLFRSSRNLRVAGMEADQVDFEHGVAVHHQKLIGQPVERRQRCTRGTAWVAIVDTIRSEEHTSELQSHHDLVCRLLLEKKKIINDRHT